MPSSWYQQNQSSIDSARTATIATTTATTNGAAMNTTSTTLATASVTMHNSDHVVNTIGAVPANATPSTDEPAITTNHLDDVESPLFMDTDSNLSTTHVQLSQASNKNNNNENIIATAISATALDRKRKKNTALVGIAINCLTKRPKLILNSASKKAKSLNPKFWKW